MFFYLNNLFEKKRIIICNSWNDLKTWNEFLQIIKLESLMKFQSVKLSDNRLL